MPSIRKALFFSAAGKYLVSGITFISIVVLARLLTPEEIGIYSAGAALVSLTHVLRQFGISDYIASRDECTPADLRGCQGVSILFAWSLGLALFASSDLVAEWYEEPRLAEVIAVGAISFFLAPLGLIPLSMLRRSMRFDVIMRVNVAQVAVGATTTITLALNGFGPVSMAWGNVANILTVVPVLTLMRAEGMWTPPSWENWRRILGYGTSVSGSSIVNEAGFSAPDMIISATLGFAPLGLFSRANGLIKMFNANVRQAVMPVALPALAKVKRAGQSLETPYVSGIEIYCALSLPFFACLAVAAEPVILVLFGSQWVGAVPLVPVLCLGAGLASIACFQRPLLLAADAPGAVLTLSIVVQSVRVAAVAAASFHSIMAVAWAVVLGNAAMVVGALYLGRRRAGVRPLRHLTAARSGVALAVLSGLTTYGALALAESWNNHILSVLAVAAITGGAWLVALALLRHPLWSEITRVISMPMPFLRMRSARGGGQS